ncbi:3'-5' exonuclease [Nocardioides sp. Y6]|uniref:3'-5' exonuclease n=1 Tax=Nocardioides malaquae TaxID=2773426 RepID=A0ABR9RT87_9ACTN|nr:3'-5' exonuclease [Nocardioides malaquae]MBE7324771.1 3'-5' exonuclease [Nocardioides malaquae]
MRGGLRRGWCPGWRPGRRPPRPEDYPAGPVRDLAAAPPPAATTPWSAIDFLAVDLETTGLDPRRDHVLTAGWVPVRGGQVVLAETREVALRLPPGVGVGDSATVHGLTDDALAGAAAPVAALTELLAALRGHVLLAHHAPIELDFIGAAVQREWGCGVPLTAVDTLRLHHRLVADAQGEAPPGSLRLDAARRHFHLPRYGAHRASTDAIAAAELLLAQAAELEARLGHPPTLRDMAPTRRR